MGIKENSKKLAKKFNGKNKQGGKKPKRNQGTMQQQAAAQQQQNGQVPPELLTQIQGGM